MASIAKRPDGRWRARYRDAAGREHSKHFDRKIDAQRWLDEVITAVVTGAYSDPKAARTTVKDWSETWITGYATRRSSTVRQARTHLQHVVSALGPMRLHDVRPSQVRTWTAELRSTGMAASYVYALHSRLSQLMSDAVHDGLLARNPCSRRASPGPGEQQAYVATTFRCGNCTMPFRSTSNRPSCSAPSPACVWPRSAV